MPGQRQPLSPPAAPVTSRLFALPAETSPSVQGAGTALSVSVPPPAFAAAGAVCGCEGSPGCPAASRPAERDPAGAGGGRAFPAAPLGHGHPPTQPRESWRACLPRLPGGRLLPPREGAQVGVRGVVPAVPPGPAAPSLLSLPGAGSGLQSPGVARGGPRGSGWLTWCLRPGQGTAGASPPPPAPPGGSSKAGSRPLPGPLRSPRGVPSRGDGEGKQEPRLSWGDLTGAEKARRTPVLAPPPPPGAGRPAGDPAQDSGEPPQPPAAWAEGEGASGSRSAPPPHRPAAKGVVSLSAWLRGGAGAVSSPIYQLPSGVRVQKEWERWVTSVPLRGEPTGAVSRGRCQHRQQHPCAAHLGEPAAPAARPARSSPADSTVPIYHGCGRNGKACRLDRKIHSIRKR